MTSTVRTQLVIAAIITVPAVVGFLAGLSLGLPGIPPEIPPVDAVPVADKSGKDVPGLPRYPGAARVKCENHPLGERRTHNCCNHGFLLRDAAEGSSVSVVQQFRSNQTTANVKRPPELVITFN